MLEFLFEIEDRCCLSIWTTLYLSLQHIIPRATAFLALATDHQGTVLCAVAARMHFLSVSIMLGLNVNKLHMIR